MVCFSEDDQVQASSHRSENAVVAGDHISFLKFKYELQNLFSSVKNLRDKELCSRQDFLSLMEKHKKLEAEHSEIYSVMQSEISSGKEAHQKLENMISDLKCEASLRESEIKHLRQEIKALMDSRNEVAEDLKFSNYSLECKLQERTHELAILMEKHERHSVLLEAVENEASLVRQAVDETNSCIREKEEEVMGLTRLVSKVLGFEDAYVGKISRLEQQMRDSSAHLSERNKLIITLEEKLAAISTHAIESDLAICRENLEMKSNLIFKMNQEKEVLLECIKNLEYMIGKLQKAIAQQDEAKVEDKEVQNLSKKFHILTENLAKTEKNLSLAIDDNNKLLKELEEQKSGFITQTQSWEAEKLAYEEKIHALEVRMVDYEASFFNKMMNDQYVVEDSFKSADSKSVCKVQLVRDEERQQDTIKDPFSSTGYQDDIIFPGHMQPWEARLSISAKQIQDGNSVKRLDLKKNKSRNIISILERLGRPINIIGMKRIPTISKPMTIVLNKSTNPARQIIPDIIKLNELTNSIVVLGINFGLSETTNRYPKLIRTAMQHEIDEYHDGNSNRGSCTDTEKEDKESE